MSNIKPGDWVRHVNHTRNGVSGEVKRVMSVEDDGYLQVFDNHGERWPLEKCIAVHPPRDKRSPRKVTWAECVEWLESANLNMGPNYVYVSKLWYLTYNGKSYSAPTRIGVVMQAMKAAKAYLAKEVKP